MIIWVAFKLDARQTDFHLKEVNKDFLRASTSITKSVMALDDLAQQEGNDMVAHEVSMLNSVLALLGDASHRNQPGQAFCHETWTKL